jgi:hypothetical protein
LPWNKLKHVDLYERESGQRWMLTAPQNSVIFSGLDIKLEVDKIYRQVEFSTTDNIPSRDVIGKQTIE